MSQSLSRLLIKDKDEHFLFSVLSGALTASYLIAFTYFLLSGNNNPFGRDMYEGLLVLWYIMAIICWPLSIRKIIQLRAHKARLRKIIGLSIIVSILGNTIGTLHFYS